MVSGFNSNYHSKAPSMREVTHNKSRDYDDDEFVEIEENIDTRQSMV